MKFEIYCLRCIRFLPPAYDFSCNYEPSSLLPSTFMLFYDSFYPDIHYYYIAKASILLSMSFNFKKKGLFDE